MKHIPTGGLRKIIIRPFGTQSNYLLGDYSDYPNKINIRETDRNTTY